MMTIFSIYFFSILSIIFVLFTITSKNPIYAILYLIVSILTIAIVFFLLGNYFAGALEIIIYAGAIIVLFVFVLMLLNINTLKEDKKNLNFLFFPVTLSTSLLTLFIYIIFSQCNYETYLIKEKTTEIKIIGVYLFHRYIIAVELISFLLLATLIVVVNIGKKSYK